MDGVSAVVLTQAIVYAGRLRPSEDSNVQVHAGLDAQQSLETTLPSVCMDGGDPVSAQFPQQSCPASADTPLKVVKKQTIRTRDTNLYV